MILYVERYGSKCGDNVGAFVVNTGRRMAWQVELQVRNDNEIIEIVRNAEKECIMEKRVMGDFSSLDFFLESAPKKKLTTSKVQQADRIYCVDINAQTVKCVKDTYTDSYEPDNGMVAQKLEELLVQL